MPFPTDSHICISAGPANVTITGPDLMNPTVSHTYSCHGYCRPSCIYAWKSDTGPWIRGQGNVISITPQMLDSSKTLLCKATNSVSGMFVTTARNINVMCKSRVITSSKTILLIKGCPEFLVMPLSTDVSF